MGIPARRALAVEDSPVGVASALNADLRCLWFRRGNDGSGHAPEADWRDQLREVGPLAAGAEELVDVSPHLSVDLVTDSLAKVLARGAAR
jgi:beta-phosphoglucomutase-like phosphatase (HAD superfamily)